MTADPTTQAGGSPASWKQALRLGLGLLVGCGAIWFALAAAGAALEAATYRISFDTAAYFRTHGIEGFYPEVSIVFAVRDASTHHHVPLLVSPYGYATYRGS